MAKRPKLFTDDDSSSSHSTRSSYDNMSTEEETTKRTRRRSEARRKPRKKELTGSLGSKLVSILTELKEMRKQSYHFAENSNEIHKQLVKLTESHNDQRKKLEKLTESHNDLCKLLELHMKGSSGDDSAALRSQLDQVQPPRYRLELTSGVSGKIEKGKTMEISVALVDCNNGRIVENGPLASATIELVVVNAEFNEHDNQHNWSREDFKRHIVTKQNPPIATTNVSQSVKSIVSNGRFNLSHGVKCHSASKIFSNSSNKKVRLGVMVVSPTEERVLEGLSNPFFVRGHDRPNRQRENRLNKQSVYDGHQEQDDRMRDMQNQSWANITQHGDFRLDDIMEGQPQPLFLGNRAILRSDTRTSQEQQGLLPQHEGLHTPIMTQLTNQAGGDELDLASFGYVRNPNVMDDDHVPVNAIGRQFNTNQTAFPVHLIWDRPNVEPSKHCWNIHDQLMPLYSCQPKFNKSGLPTMHLMSEDFGSLSIISKEVQTCPKRGVLIEPVEPDDSLDQGKKLTCVGSRSKQACEHTQPGAYNAGGLTLPLVAEERAQGRASNDSDDNIESVDLRAVTEPFAVEDQQQNSIYSEGNGNSLVSPTWKHWFRRLVQWRQRDPSTRQFVRQLFGHEQSGFLSPSLGGFTIFKFSQLTASTNNFSLHNKIGGGGFGGVYKGVLPNGVDVAIKRKHNEYNQCGDFEFGNEIQIIPKLQHANIIKLLGYCIEGSERILVYEYMPRSLDNIVQELKDGVFLAWALRFRIIEGIAQGVVYLHQHSRLRLVHRDLKPSNILLDCDTTPRISDFGIAEVLDSDEDEKETMTISGTMGYIAPECMIKGTTSTHNDVYTFGVTVLQIITAQDAMIRSDDITDGMSSLPAYAWKLWSSRRAWELVDASLHDEPEISEILRCMQIALLCVQEEQEDRPTMSDVLMMLKYNSVALPVPRSPPLGMSRQRPNDWPPDANDQAEGCISYTSYTTGR